MIFSFHSSNQSELKDNQSSSRCVQGCLTSFCDRLLVAKYIGCCDKPIVNLFVAEIGF